MIRRFVRFLGSVSLFLVLLAALLVISALGTVVAPETTLVGSASPVRRVIFVGLLAAMEINLLVCTVPRLVRRLRTRSLPLKAYVADIIHVGLILVIAGGAVSAFLRQEERFLVETGATVVFGSPPASVRVVDSRALRDESGTVLGWEIDLDHRGMVHTVALNDPIRIAGYRVHFFHWGEEPILTLRDRDDTRYSLRPGEGYRRDDGTARVFTGASEGDGGTGARVADIAVVGAAGETITTLSLVPGDGIDRFTVASIEMSVQNGFRVSRDPGRPVIAVGLAILFTGLALFGVKRKDG